jgi:hypothetical protein
MMDISLTGSGYILPMVIIGIVVIVVIAVVLLQGRSKERHQPRGGLGSYQNSSGNRLDYQPESRPTPAIHIVVNAPPTARTAEAPKPKEMDLTSACSNTTESLQALVEKYSLKSFTIATADGLIFGSSGDETDQADAAIFSAIFKNDPLAETPGVVLFGLAHKGSDLIGIARIPSPLPRGIIQQIAADTKIILNWWI